MVNYNLGVLNDKEFENLCKDLLEVELDIKLQNFSKGRDKGIDLRHSSDLENKVIVQCKHYWNSKFSDLKFALKDERKKLKKLNPKPKRYLLTTSLSLSSGQVDELVEILKPLTKSGDIYGYDRINSLIQNIEYVERKYFKLWISSTNVLQRILNNGAKGRSEFYEDKILKKISLYVPTRDYKGAVSKLKKERFIIVTGEPGIGKTTISYLLICELLAKKYQLIYIDDKISEAEQLLSPDPKKKQIFFFDDFLGSNLHAIANPKNSESSILGFIERIQSDKNKLLILTTRTTILKQAEYSFEKLGRSKISEISRYEVRISSYSRLDKAKILYNHLFHSSISDNQKLKISQSKNYLRIIDHLNYSPRLIEFISDNRNFSADDETDYIKFIDNSLNNPKEIWRGAYENQLGDNDRFLLTTLFSLGGYKIKSNILEDAFTERIKYEIESGGHTRTNNAFNAALKRLLDGFIISQRNEGEHVNEYSFINPSVGDFLINYLKESKSEVLRIVLSAAFTEQWLRNFHPKNQQYVTLTINYVQNSYNHFVNRSKLLKCASDNKCLSVDVLRIYFSFFPKNIKESQLVPWVQTISVKSISSYQLNPLITIIEELYKYSKCRNLITNDWNLLVLKLYSLADNFDEYNSIRRLFDIYEIDFNEFHNYDETNQFISECIHALFQQTIDNDFDLGRSDKDRIMGLVNSNDRDSAELIVQEAIEEEFSSFISNFNLTDSYTHTSLNLSFVVADVVDKIYEREQTQNENFESDYENDFFSEGHNESDEIDRLFDS